MNITASSLYVQVQICERVWRCQIMLRVWHFMAHKLMIMMPKPILTISSRSKQIIRTSQCNLFLTSSPVSVPIKICLPLVKHWVLTKALWHCQLCSCSLPSRYFDVWCVARTQTLNTSSSSRIRSSSREPFDGRTTTFCTVPLSASRISEHQENILDSLESKNSHLVWVWTEYELSIVHRFSLWKLLCVSGLLFDVVEHLLWETDLQTRFPKNMWVVAKVSWVVAMCFLTGSSQKSPLSSPLIWPVALLQCKGFLPSVWWKLFIGYLQL